MLFHLKSAPVEATNAAGNTADINVVGRSGGGCTNLRLSNGECRARLCRTVGIGSTQAAAFPLLEDCVAAVADLGLVTVGVKQCKLVQRSLIADMLPAVDVAAAAAVVTTGEEAEVALAGGCCAGGDGVVRLQELLA